MTGKQIDFMESEGLDTTGMRRFNNESISRGVANTHVFQETLQTSSGPFHSLNVWEGLLRKWGYHRTCLKAVKQQWDTYKNGNIKMIPYTFDPSIMSNKKKIKAAMKAMDEDICPF